MVKRNSFGLVVSLAIVITVTPVQANQSVKFTPALGFMWDQMFLWTLGLSIDFYIVKSLTITPELFMANKEIGFSVSKDEDMGFDPTYFLQPGVMMNYHHPSFFVGAGVVRSYQARNAWFYEGPQIPRTVVWDVVWTQAWKLKISVGIKISKIRLTAFFLTDFHDLGWFPTAESNAYAATIGYTI